LINVAIQPDIALPAVPTGCPYVIGHNLHELTKVSVQVGINDIAA